jgi:hypothetical protein
MNADTFLWRVKGEIVQQSTGAVVAEASYGEGLNTLDEIIANVEVPTVDKATAAIKQRLATQIEKFKAQGRITK